MPMFAIPLMQRQYGPERKMDRWVAETNVGGLIMGYYPLAERDRNARAPLEAFDFQQPPRQPVPLP